MSVCVRPGWKPRRPVFSRRGSLILNFEMMFNRIFDGKKINVLHMCKLCKVYVEISDDFHK